MKNGVLFIFLIMSSCVVIAQQIPIMNTDSIKNKWKDLPYAENSPAQRLDIYLPESGEGPFPVIISIHGGAFMIGDKSDMQLKPMLEGLQRGYAVVSINYRMSDETTAPKLINDVKAAIRWVRANAQKYKMNANKIAVWGGSAGGHLSSLAGTSGDVKELEDLTMGNPKESSRVQAVVDWFGPINFLTMDDQFYMLGVKGMPHNSPGSPESKVIGKYIVNAEAEVRAFNPETYISKDDPPFFIQHGSKDPLIPYLQSMEFSNALYLVLGKDKVNVELIEGAGHGTSQFSDPKNLEKVFTFLDKYLKN
jgi:acetyl esterase/lipase